MCVSIKFLLVLFKHLIYIYFYGVFVFVLTKIRFRCLFISTDTCFRQGNFCKKPKKTTKIRRERNKIEKVGINNEAIVFFFCLAHTNNALFFFFFFFPSLLQIGLVVPKSSCLIILHLLLEIQGLDLIHFEEPGNVNSRCCLVQKGKDATVTLFNFIIFLAWTQPKFPLISHNFSSSSLERTHSRRASCAKFLFHFYQGGNEV